MNTTDQPKVAGTGMLVALALAAIPMITFAVVVSLYMGIESAVEVGEEIRNARAVIAKGLASAVILTIIVYVSVSSVALGVLGAGSLGASDAPLFDAGSLFLGRWNTPLIIFAAVASIGTSLLVGCLYWVVRGQRMSGSMRDLQAEPSS